MPLFIGVFQSGTGYRKNTFLVSRFSLGTIDRAQRETRNEERVLVPCAIPPLNSPSSPLAPEQMQSLDEYDSIGNNSRTDAQRGIQISPRHPGPEPARPGIANDPQGSGLNRPSRDGSYHSHP